MWCRNLRRTRGLVFPMGRFGRMYEKDHVHLVFRKPVAEFHALTTEVLVVPQRHNRCDYNPFSTRTRSHSLCESSDVPPVVRDVGMDVQTMVRDESFRRRRRAEKPFQAGRRVYLSALMYRRASSSERIRLRRSSKDETHKREERRSESPSKSISN